MQTKLEPIIGHYHNWCFQPTGISQKVEAHIYALATEYIRELVITANNAHKVDTGESLVSGHTPHSTRAYPGIDFNGKQPNDCQTFHLPPTWQEATSLKMIWSCQTNRLPYDSLVMASLIALYTILGPDRVTITSKGTRGAWQQGMELATTYSPSAYGLYIPDTIQK